MQESQNTTKQCAKEQDAHQFGTRAIKESRVGEEASETILEGWLDFCSWSW